ncbi:hypothetical protein N6G96_07125 [Pediococcus inopinatus]|uniref:Uncharacterized protein n=1 Tax=Pediococcus inopinatus TaxID=114090 RepID=A0ABZ0Q2B0_9LACO|nr:hypothetical protein [Pediococcus inopinatus]WPC19271.1 hypothetical protein N6G95_08550 [Pediococcus inopinatus]WPC21061.1 hypothetical protein N6G96_07125 [Pediococcus inopinatus]
MAYRVKDVRNNRFVWTYLDLVEVDAPEKEASKFNSYDEAQDYVAMANIITKKSNKGHSFIVETI